MKNKIIIFENQKVKLEVNIQDETVWLNTEQIATLFDRDYKTIRKHINNVLSEELQGEKVVAKFANTTEHGAIAGKTQIHMINYYNLDVIISVGYRVKSHKVLDIPNGTILKKNLVGKNLANYDSMLVLSHFKGHAMGGYGGALKQLSIGVSSSAGKTLIHTAGAVEDQKELWNNLPEQDRFLEAMADAASSVVKYFDKKIVFINVMKNISVDCDCDGNASAPCMNDIGILASIDPIAIDQACLDLVYNSDDQGSSKLIERIESLHGVHTIEASSKLGFGTREYELINMD